MERSAMSEEKDRKRKIIGDSAGEKLLRTGT